MDIVRIKKLILPVLFAVFIIGISFLTFVLPKDKYSENEKRYLAEFPEFSIKSVLNGEFQNGFESYVSDHVFGRNFFVGLNSYFSLLMGRNTVSDIYFAKDGYLINAPKAQGTENFEKNLKNFNEFTKKVDVASSIMIVPSTGYIMKDKLPAFAKKYEDSSLFELAASFTPAISFIDARSVLFNAVDNENKQVYYRTDHHLTSEGTYELYKLYCSSNGLTYPKKEWYDIKKAEGFSGTTFAGSGYLLTKPDTVEMWIPKNKVKVTIDDSNKVNTYESMFFEKHLEADDKYPVFLDGNHALTTIENLNSDGENLLIIKDSYAHSLAPFLSYNYKKIVLVDMRYYRKSVSELIEENEIDEILYIYGTDSLITDTNSAWLQ